MLPPLPAPLSKALADQGFDTLTAVQEAVLDPALAGQDLLVSAQTGSGKTVAFGLALAPGLLDDAGQMPPADTPRALVVAPTRELALQVQRELAWLYGGAGAIIASCVGGMDPRAERRALERGAHIAVGTPGRLRDHLERGALDPSLLATVVLDEADEMLDLGFREDLEFILQTLPENRRTLMFSATVSPGIARLAETYQRSAQRIATQSARDAHADIAYRALAVSPQDSENAIVNVLRFYEARNAIVFCKTRAMVNHLTARFLNRGFPVVPLSGELAQDERARALQAMRDGRARVCVATDVAARGIDLPGLDLVIHADLPTNRETLLHRSGRTGRAGRKGVSVLIVPQPARKRMERLLREAGVEAEWAPAPSAADVTARDTERLLSDPALTAPETGDEGALITLLIERFTARELAAGVARQYFAARSAPEDVSTGDSAPRPRTDFTEGRWLRLSVGADKGAEARWILPLLCRTGQIDRADIGAIRVQSDHTMVQLMPLAAEGLMQRLKGAALEGEIAVSYGDAPASAGAARPAPRAPRPPRPHDTPGVEGGASAERPRAFPKPDRPKPPYQGDKPKSDYGATRPRGDHAGERPKPAYGDKPKPAYGGDRPKPAYGDKPKPAYGDKPKPAYGDRPKPAYGDKPKPPRSDDKPRPERKEWSERAPAASPQGAASPKPRAPKPARTDGPKGPRSDRKPAFDGPRKPAAEAPARRAAAADPSMRLERPGKPARPAAAGKPGGKPFGKPGGKPGGKPSGKPGGKPGGSGKPFRPKG